MFNFSTLENCLEIYSYNNIAVCTQATSCRVFGFHTTWDSYQKFIVIFIETYYYLKSIILKQDKICSSRSYFIKETHVSLIF